MNNRLNVLDKNRYLISKKLFDVLLNEKLSNDKRIKKELGIYLVGFRVLNHEDKSLVFNYVYYPSIFLEAYLAFIAHRNISSIRFNEWGDTLVVVDKGIVEQNPLLIGSSNSNDKSNRYSLTNKLEYHNTLESYDKDYFEYLPIESFISLINKLNFCTNNLDECSYILNLAIQKEYIKYIQYLLYPMYSDTKFHLYWNERLSNNIKNLNSINLVNTILFVVNDVVYMKNLIEKSGYTISEGPSKWRGQINSINGLLGSMDLDFRNSLYNHHSFYIRNGLIPNKFQLDKSKFSFRNIHMNIGNVRWIHTSKKSKINRDVLSAKLLKKVNKFSIKVDSEIYLYLNNYIKNSPINEKTQREIETFLYNYSYMSLESDNNKQTDSKYNLNYKLFGDRVFKKYVVEASNNINDFLLNFKDNTYNISTKRVSLKTKSRYYFKSILDVLDNSKIIELALGIFVKIVSNHHKFSQDCTLTNISFEIGDIICKNYFYLLYKSYMIEGFKSFCKECESYLTSDDNFLNEKDKEVVNKYINDIKKGLSKLELYKIKYLISNILDINSMNKINFNNTDSIVSYTLSDWQLDNQDIVDIFDCDTSLKASIGGIVIDWLIECKLLEQTTIVLGKKEVKNFLVPNETIISLIDSKKDFVIKHLPLRIPMLVKPKLYKREIIDGKIKERLGGYLINDELIVDSMIIPNWELKESSLIHQENVVYDLVNNVGSVGFKINTEMLDFINIYGDQFNLFLDNININIEGKKISKDEYTELESYQSKLDLQENILGLAKVFSLIPEFFIPVRLDYRGRMNCVSQYLNYQSNELAKSLLLFSKGEKIMKNDMIAISYLKAYGANCFGNKLDKKSWLDRSKWVDDNVNNIRDYTNGILISQSENKFLFTAFCIEYTKWLKAFDNTETSYFLTHLPIQLDATCNGYQHLSLLISDSDLAKELNLTKSDWNDEPKDYYGFTGIKLIELFKHKLKVNKLSVEDRECYERLSNMLILRKTVKKVIMTIPYNVSIFQMIRYLKEHFVKFDTDNKSKWLAYTLEYKHKDDPKLILCSKDFTFIATGLKEVLEKNFPKLKSLIIYLKTIAKICTRLGLIIPWGTSSGLLVNQSYVSSDEIKLFPFSYSKSSLTLNIPTKKLNNKKQIRALMPNLIHSLDASTLALLADSYFNNNDFEANNFYAIHDCFAVTANNVDILIKYLKLAYIRIYTDDIYLKRFDQGVLQYIQLTYGDKCSFDSDTYKMTIKLGDMSKNLELDYPNINHVLGTELPNPNLIRDSSYLIN